MSEIRSGAGHALVRFIYMTVCRCDGIHARDPEWTGGFCIPKYDVLTTCILHATVPHAMDILTATRFAPHLSLCVPHTEGCVIVE